MAEIHVEPRKKSTGSNTWIWILVALIIIAVVAYLVYQNQTGNAPAVDTTNTAPGAWLPVLNPLAAINTIC